MLWHHINNWIRNIISFHGDKWTICRHNQQWTSLRCCCYFIITPRQNPWIRVCITDTNAGFLLQSRSLCLYLCWFVFAALHACFFELLKYSEGMTNSRKYFLVILVKSWNIIQVQEMLEGIPAQHLLGLQLLSALDPLSHFLPMKNGAFNFK